MSGRTRWLRARGLMASLMIAVLTASFAPAVAQARDLSAGVKGIVLDAATGKAVPGVRVYVMEKYYPWGYSPGATADWDWRPVAETTTTRSGAYSVKLAVAGTYRVYFVPADPTRYAREAYPNAAIPELGDPVVVRYGRTTSNISVKLDPPVRIEGHLWKAESRWDAEGNDDGIYEPLAGVTVNGCFQSMVIINCAIRNPDDGGGVPLAQAVTDAEGYYRLDGFKSFPFFAWANLNGFPAGYDPALSSLILDPQDATFPDGIKTSDAFLQRTDLANVTGRLVDEGGQPLADRTIRVYEVDQSEAELSFQPKCDVTTDDDGYFGGSTASDEDKRCLNLWEPAAVLEFPDQEGLAREYFDDADQVEQATQVPVDWGRTQNIGEWTVSPIS